MPHKITIELDLQAPGAGEVLDAVARSMGSAPATAPAAPPAEPATAPAAPLAEPASDGGLPEQDANGVAFNEEFCTKGKTPLDGEGKWKKRRGVDKNAFETWYAGAVAAAGGNTAGAFGADSAPPAPPADSAPPAPPADSAPPAPPADSAPMFREFGPFITWFAEQQTAQNVDQSDLEEAYRFVGITIPDVMPPNTPDKVAQRLTECAQFLIARGAQAPTQ